MTDCLCAECGAEMDGFDCPRCDSDRRIFAGALQPHPHPKHRYGGSA